MGPADGALSEVSSLVSVDLIQASRKLVKLLLAVDCFPHGEAWATMPLLMTTGRQLDHYFGWWGICS